MIKLNESPNASLSTQVVNIHKNEEFDVYIGRGGKGQNGYFGNPFVLTHESKCAEVVEQYRKYFYERIEKDEEFKKRILDLKNKRLGCFCSPRLCHGHVIAEYVDNYEEEK